MPIESRDEGVESTDAEGPTPAKVSRVFRLAKWEPLLLGTWRSSDVKWDTLKVSKEETPKPKTEEPSTVIPGPSAVTLVQTEDLKKSENDLQTLVVQDQEEEEPSVSGMGQTDVDEGHETLEESAVEGGKVGF